MATAKEKKSAEKKSDALETAATKPVTTKKSSAKKASEKTSAINAASEKSAATKVNKVGAEERYRMIEVASYFIAERDKFKASPLEYWAAAEEQISMMLAKK